MALPLAPVQRFEEGLDAITNAADRIAENYPVVLQFIRYMRIRWLPVKELISVARASLQLSYLFEGLHKILGRKLGGTHLSAWAFLGAYTSELSFFVS